MKHNYKPLTTFFKWLLSFFKKSDKWEYGTCGKYKRHARRHVMKGNVQFVLWESGKHGHEEDFWCDFDCSWWTEFKPYEQHLKDK